MLDGQVPWKAPDSKPNDPFMIVCSRMELAESCLGQKGSRRDVGFLGSSGTF